LENTISMINIDDIDELKDIFHEIIVEEDKTDELYGMLEKKIKINTLLDEEDISLILMDRNLPGCEGSEYIQKLRNDGYMTPVIYLSAKF